ncbi:MAG: amidohydrolase family protein [Nocardioides sp.]
MTRDLVVDDLAALDVHVHVEIDDHGHPSLGPELMEASAAYFKAGHRTPTVDEIAERYRSLSMAAVVFTVDHEAATGHPPIANEYVAEAAQAHPDVLIPFGSVDPARGLAAVRAVRRLVTEHDIQGFKFHPSLQDFDPSDRAHDPLYDAIAEMGVPAVFHTGQTGIGAGLPGGGGIRLGLSNPMLLDEVAARHPGLTVVMAHPSVPWQDEALSVATHKANVYIDLSGWSPKYFAPNLVRHINSLLQDKVMFGSDFPVITPERWLSDFEQLDIKQEVRPKVLKENAVRVLGLGGRSA